MAEIQIHQPEPKVETEARRKEYVATAVIVKDGKLLLIKRGRKPHKGEWALISGIGASKQGLESKEGVGGEVMGDLGVEIETPEELITIPTPEDEKADKNIAFVCRLKEGEEIKPNTNLVENGVYEWVSLDDERLKSLPFEQTEIVDTYKKRISQNLS